MQLTKSFAVPDRDYAVSHACLLSGSHTNSNEKAGNESLVVVERSQGNAKRNGSRIKYVLRIEVSTRGICLRSDAPRGDLVRWFLVTDELLDRPRQTGPVRDLQGIGPFDSLR